MLGKRKLEFIKVTYFAPVNIAIKWRYWGFSPKSQSFLIYFKKTFLLLLLQLHNKNSERPLGGKLSVKLSVQLCLIYDFPHIILVDYIPWSILGDCCLLCSQPLPSPWDSCPPSPSTPPPLPWAGSLCTDPALAGPPQLSSLPWVP